MHVECSRHSHHALLQQILSKRSHESSLAYDIINISFDLQVNESWSRYYFPVSFYLDQASYIYTIVIGTTATIWRHRAYLIKVLKEGWYHQISPCLLTNFMLWNMNMLCCHRSSTSFPNLILFEPSFWYIPHCHGDYCYTVTSQIINFLWSISSKWLSLR